MTTPAIKRTSEMVHPLKEPEGWFLQKAQHQHLKVGYRGDEYKPLAVADGPWCVEFRKYSVDFHVIVGRGHTLEEAWHKTVAYVDAYEMKGVK